MFVQTTWSYATEGYSPDYSPAFQAILGWGTLVAVALAAAVMTSSRWLTPVDDFVPLDLDDVEGVK